jgi:hypothetical protein
LAWFYAASLGVLYIFVSTHTPLKVLAEAPHDDGLYISLGRYLAEGGWLGPYSQFTLMKGPGYPAFLALNNWLGTPISFSHALFHVASVTIFVLVAHRFMQSWLFSGLLFTLLLWQPVALSTPLLRVLRDRIYFDQLLILFAASAWALFGDGRTGRLLAAFLGGAMLGWFWLTREEGAWIVPGLFALAGAVLLQTYRTPRFLETVGTIAVVAGVFIASQLAFSAVNAAVYGKFVGVDFKERNFQRALAALDSVRSGGTKPFVSITFAAMARVAPASPAFASLESYFDGPGRGWETFGCPIFPSSCGEISSGWFMWALRDAAQRAGHYSSPTEASAFFGKLADEVEAACERGELECVVQPIAEMPPINLRQLADSLRHYFGAAISLLFLLDHSTDPGASNGSQGSLRAALRFLHYPMHTRPLASPRELLPYAISGWYYRFGSEWISIVVTRADGSTADTLLERQDSPDIAEHFKDGLASRQRFALVGACDGTCMLQVGNAQGDTASKTFAELRNNQNLRIGGGTLRIDDFASAANVSDDASPAEVAAQWLRDAIFKLYKFFYVPALLVGFACFVVATLDYGRRAIANTCYLMALVSWLLVLSRVGLLLLIAATSLPALAVHYMAPAYFLLVSGAVFSCAALIQLRRELPRRAGGVA